MDRSVKVEGIPSESLTIMRSSTRAKKSNSAHQTVDIIMAKHIRSNWNYMEEANLGKIFVGLDFSAVPNFLVKISKIYRQNTRAYAAVQYLAYIRGAVFHLNNLS